MELQIMRKTFKEFITEEHQRVEIDIDPKLALLQLDKANEDLEAVTLRPFQNSAVFVNTVRGTLERYGIVLPAYSNMQQLSLEGETVYALGSSGMFVYMVWNLNDEQVLEGYAQIVNQEDLDDLKELNASSDEGIQREPSALKVSDWRRYPPARRDDDSGNDDEYT
jgi:hypothetical protein